MTTISEIVTAATAPDEIALSGVNVLLMGPAGTGKTHSIGTLVEASPKLQVFYLGLEPGLETLQGFWKDKGKPVPENFHWHQLAAAKASFTDLLENAKRVNTMSLETLAKANDPNRSKHNRFIHMLEILNNFVDDRTGKNYGAVDEWGTDKVLVIDGMAGLAHMAMSLVVGNKPVRNISDWGIAQQQIEQIIRLWTDACKCHFVLIAHVEREKDEVLGGIKLMVSTLGAKLAPKLPPMFSDCILTERSGTSWTWNTGSAQADVKTRNLPVSEKLAADFKPIIEKWQKRGGVI